MSNEQEYKKSPWYRPVSQADYIKLGQMGSATIKIRILPGVDENRNMYNPIMSKDVSTSPYPTQPRWMAPVLVIDDQLHPEKNGLVGIFDFPKTIHRVLCKDTAPPNFFDINNGFTFNIVVSLQQSKDGESVFPNYAKSHFDSTPSPVNAKYVAAKMKEYDLLDFRAVVDRINQALTNPKPKAEEIENPYASPSQPAATPPQQAQNTQQVPWAASPTPPPSTSVPVAPPTEEANEDFDELFGTPTDEEVPF